MRAMRSPISKAGLVLAATCLAVPPAFAQVDQAVTPPTNLVLSNYNSVPVGPFGGLEGQAVVARVGDPSAAWFNPAGLAQEAGAQISGSAGVYERTAVSPRALPNGGSSVQQLPNLVGFTIKANSRNRRVAVRSGCGIRLSLAVGIPGRRRRRSRSRPAGNRAADVRIDFPVCAARH
jgi:hypothetical protein